MKRLIPILFCVVFLISCDKEEKPSGLLSEDQMVNVLVDIHLTEGVSSALPIPYDSSQVLYRLLEREVFVEHEISDSTFVQSMRYYLQYPKTMDEIYARVVDTLVVKESTPMTEENF